MQIVAFVSDFFSGPEWFRIIIALILLAMTQQISKKYEIPYINGLKRIPQLLVLRELIAAFYFTPTIYYISDAIILVIYLWWLNSYSEHRKTTTTYTIIVIGITAALVTAYEFFPEVTLTLFAGKR
jgi:sigma-B regulation protein RsbU (phosphoserine phosphatase)